MRLRLATPTGAMGDKRSRSLLAAGLFLILVGSRAALISHAGSATPFMDEWDGDWAGLIKPYLDGALTLEGLVAPFMEHRILFTRVIVLSIFHVSGYWDVVLQMIVNAILSSTCIVLTSFALARVLSGGWALAAIATTSLVNVIPFSFDNVLLGFNTHFYLLPALSLLGLWLIAGSRAWSLKWAAGAVFGASSFFCLASGALTLAAALACHLAQMACGRRAGLREWLGAAALAGAVAVLIGFIPHIPESDALRSQSPGEFLSALARLAGWPAGPLLGLLLPLPSAMFCLRVVADRADVKDPRWFNFAAAAWVFAQIAAIALGRGNGGLQSRYLDMLMLALAIHFVSALWIVQAQAQGAKRRATAGWVLAAWVAIVAVSLQRAERPIPKEIEAWRQTVGLGGRNIRDFLKTGDVASLSGAPILTIPYPDQGALRAYLGTPEIRSSLPPELLSQPPGHNPVEAFKQGFLGFAAGWSALGVVLLAVALAWPPKQRECRSPANDALPPSSSRTTA